MTDSYTHLPAPFRVSNELSYFSQELQLEIVFRGARGSYAVSLRRVPDLRLAYCTTTIVPEPGWIPAISGGSLLYRDANISAGNSHDFIGGAHQGDAVWLMEAGSHLDRGYPYWLVQLSDGAQGYHWGGRLCAPGVHVDGIVNDAC